MAEKSRCPWPGVDPVYVAYHDEEWGVPEPDSRALYEKLILDGFQAGLSWITILRKRDNFRSAFHEFEPARIARYGEKDVVRLLGNAGIIRHRGKIESAVKSARAWLAIEESEPGGFAHYIWKFVDAAPKQNALRTMKEAPTETEMSRKLAKDLKSRGFNFCGPTIAYAFAQAVGMVNDHLVTCFRYAEVAKLGRKLKL